MLNKEVFTLILPIYHHPPFVRYIYIIRFRKQQIYNKESAKMKQGSLLDSFIKRQVTPAKKQQNQAKTPQDNGMTNQKANNQKAVKAQLARQKNSKMCLDSDEEIEINKLNIVEDKELYQPQDKPIKINKKKSIGIERKKSFNENNQNKQNHQQFFTDKTPEWATQQKCRDKNMRTPSDPGYDNTTLYIPDQAWKQFTASMKQFWKIKSQNYDKIVLFKLGKFYELFYDDAAVGNKYLDLKWMGTKMHTGFPQKTLEYYTSKLMQYGFKVVVVQQMETVDQMNERIKEQKAKGQRSQKTINRNITQILTKGTTPSIEGEDNFLPNYLISVRFQKDLYAYSLLEVGTNAIIMGVAETFDRFKTLLFQTRPVELLYDPDNLTFHDVDMMRQSFLQMIITKLPNSNHIWHPLNACNHIDTFEAKPKIFQTIDTWDSDYKNLLYSTLSGMFAYLKNVFKFDYVMSAVKFTFYQRQNRKSTMSLDSQALQHLQIFQTAAGSFGSLFTVIDRTKTKFGRRLFRRWMMSPLFNVSCINDRLNAIEDLQQISLQRNQASEILKKIPDIQKTVNKVYHYAVKSLANKAIYFEDISTSRLKEFRQLISNIELGWKVLDLLSKNKNSFKSHRLKQLLQIDKNDNFQASDKIYFDEEVDVQENSIGLLPDVIGHLNQFKSYIKWQGDLPIPQKGLVQSYDTLQDDLARIKDQLQEYLEGLRNKIKEPNLKFTHTKERYQIQIPQKSEKRRPQQMIFTSKRAGFSRYVTQESRQLVKRYQRIENDIKEQMGLFVGFFFDEFKKKQRVWETFIAILAEIDCLIGMSIYSFQNSVVRPKFPNNKFQIRNAVHPCLKIDFIPNDIVMDKKVMLLTGPNMGGKSTLLRTACTLVIMAQMGLYVPSTLYQCEPIDRIFTRIGASDQLQEGKSTFFIEMEETKNVLINATSKSLVIMDELGRGTSTFDGMAIAFSVLRDIIQRVECYCLFATHYHSLVHEFSESKEISFKMMDCQVSDHRLIFWYKLVEGTAGESFGVNVGKVVGINSNILQRAKDKAILMEELIEKKRNKAFLEIQKMFQFNE